MCGTRQQGGFQAFGELMLPIDETGSILPGLQPQRRPKPAAPAFFRLMGGACYRRKMASSMRVPNFIHNR
jgi:hypothetical protein